MRHQPGLVSCNIPSPIGVLKEFAPSVVIRIRRKGIRIMGKVSQKTLGEARTAGEFIRLISIQFK